MKIPVDRRAATPTGRSTRARRACASSARGPGRCARAARPRRRRRAARRRPRSPRGPDGRRDRSPRRRSRVSSAQLVQRVRVASSCSSTSSTPPKCVRREARRLPGRDQVERGVPGLDVDVRRRRRRDRHVRRRDAHARRRRRRRRARVLVQVADVVRGVAGRVLDAEAPAAGSSRRPAGRGRARLRHRQHLAPQRSSVVAVEAPGAREQLRRVDQVRRAALVHVDLEVGPALARARRWRPRGRGGCASAAARAGARLRAPRAACDATTPGPGSTSTPPTRQQQMTRSRPLKRDVDRLARGLIARPSTYLNHTIESMSEMPGPPTACPSPTARG